MWSSIILHLTELLLPLSRRIRTYGYDYGGAATRSHGQYPGRIRPEESICSFDLPRATADFMEKLINVPGPFT